MKDERRFRIAATLRPSNELEVYAPILQRWAARLRPSPFPRQLTR